MEYVFKFIIACFALASTLIAFGGILLFVHYTNRLGSTLATIINSGIVMICIVTIACGFKYMGTPYIVMYGAAFMIIGYTIDAVHLLKRQ